MIFKKKKNISNFDPFYNLANFLIDVLGSVISESLSLLNFLPRIKLYNFAKKRSVVVSLLSGVLV